MVGSGTLVFPLLFKTTGSLLSTIIVVVVGLISFKTC